MKSSILKFGPLKERGFFYGSVGGAGGGGGGEFIQNAYRNKPGTPAFQVNGSSDGGGYNGKSGGAGATGVSVEFQVQ